METVESKCPECGGEAVEVTDTLDSERRFLCIGHEDAFGRFSGGGCGHHWGEPFPEVDEQPGEHGWKL